LGNKYSAGPNLRDEIVSPILYDFGQNIIGAGAGSFDTSGFSYIANADPFLVFRHTVDNHGVLAGLVADNGGAVESVALKPFDLNPAIDAGVGMAGTVPITEVTPGFPVDANYDGDFIDTFLTIEEYLFDTRGPGFARVFGTEVDLGAFELQSAALNGIIGTPGNDVPLFGTNGQADYIEGLAGNDTIHGFGNNDFLFGGDDDDFLLGGTGADVLDGGDGFDRAQYNQSTAGLRADLMFANTNTGEAAGDQYISIENLFGTNFNDALYGDADDNMISGHFGNDVLFGRNGDDTLVGGDGNDVLLGGLGADTLDGSAGIDRVQYSMAAAVVRADLMDSTTNTGEAAGDRYARIEDLFGSAFDDTLVGNQFANVIIGGNGNDTIFGLNSGDSLVGGNGDDVLNGGADRDTADYSTSSTGLRADLLAPGTNLARPPATLISASKTCPARPAMTCCSAIISTTSCRA
jgi:Ca2+-binding RTX toxin-like protein